MTVINPNWRCEIGEILDHLTECSTGESGSMRIVILAHATRDEWDAENDFAPPFPNGFFYFASID